MDMSVNLNASYHPVVTQTDATSAPVMAAAATATTATSATAATGTISADPVKQPDRAELESAVKDMQAYVDSTQRGLRFSIDDTTHQVVVKIVATQTGEVVQQLPSEAALKLARYLKETNSMMLDTQV